jgi:hypothetical protein
MPVGQTIAFCRLPFRVGTMAQPPFAGTQTEKSGFTK